MIDDRTANFALPLPNAQNTLSEDVDRIRTAITGIDDALQQHTANTSALTNTVAEHATQFADAINNEQTMREQADTQLTDNLAKIRVLALAGL